MTVRLAAPARLTATLLILTSCGSDALGPEPPRGDSARGASPSPRAKASATPNVQVRVGLEQLEADHGGALKGK